MPPNNQTLATLSVRLEAVGYKDLAREIFELDKRLQQLDTTGELTSTSLENVPRRISEGSQEAQDSVELLNRTFKELLQRQRELASPVGRQRLGFFDEEDANAERQRIQGLLSEVGELRSFIESGERDIQRYRQRIQAMPRVRTPEEIRAEDERERLELAAETDPRAEQELERQVQLEMEVARARRESAARQKEANRVEQESAKVKSTVSRAAMESLRTTKQETQATREASEVQSTVSRAALDSLRTRQQETQATNQAAEAQSRISRATLEGLRAKQQETKANAESARAQGTISRAVRENLTTQREATKANQAAADSQSRVSAGARQYFQTQQKANQAARETARAQQQEAATAKQVAATQQTAAQAKSKTNEQNVKVQQSSKNVTSSQEDEAKAALRLAEAEAMAARSLQQVRREELRTTQASQKAVQANVKAHQAAGQSARTNVQLAKSAQNVAQANANLAQQNIQVARTQVQLNTAKVNTAKAAVTNAKNSQQLAIAQQRLARANNNLAVSQQKVSQQTHAAATIQARLVQATANVNRVQNQGVVANNALAQATARVGQQTGITSVSLRGFRRVLEGSVYTASVVGRALAALESGTAFLVAGFAFLSSAVVASISHLARLEKQLRPLQARSQLTYETLQTLGNTVQALGLDRGGGGGGIQGLQMGFEAAAEASQELRTRLGELEQFGSGPAKDALAALNIELDDLLARSQDDRLFTIITALQQIPTVSLRQHLAEELLGDTGAEGLATVINSTSREMQIWQNTISRLNANLTTDQLRNARRLNDSWERARLALNSVLQEFGALIAPLVTDILHNLSALLQGLREFLTGMSRAYDRLTGFLSDAFQGRLAAVSTANAVYQLGATSEILETNRAARILSGGSGSFRGAIRGAQIGRGVATIGRVGLIGAITSPIVLQQARRLLGIQDNYLRNELDLLELERARERDPFRAGISTRGILDETRDSARTAELDEFGGDLALLRTQNRVALRQIDDNFNRTDLRAREDHIRALARLERNYLQQQERQREQNAARRLALIARFDKREQNLRDRADDQRARIALQTAQRLQDIEDRAQERREESLRDHRYRLEDIERGAERDIEDARDEVGHSFAQFNIRRVEIERDTARRREDERIRNERRLFEIDEDERQSRIGIQEDQAERIKLINEQLSRDLEQLEVERAAAIAAFDIQVKAQAEQREQQYQQSVADLVEAYNLARTRRQQDYELARFQLTQSHLRAEIEAQAEHAQNLLKIQGEYQAASLESRADFIASLDEQLTAAQRQAAIAAFDRGFQNPGLANRALSESDLFGASRFTSDRARSQAIQEANLRNQLAIEERLRGTILDILNPVGGFGQRIDILRDIGRGIFGALANNDLSAFHSNIFPNLRTVEDFRQGRARLPNIESINVTINRQQFDALVISIIDSYNRRGALQGT